MKYILVLTGLILLSFIFLQPKLSAWLFPFKRHMVWNEFVQDVKKTNHIDERAFWQFREFYYPGYFTFERLGFDTVKTKDAEKRLRVKLFGGSNQSVFLIYKSGKLNSLEALVNNAELAKTIIDQSPLKRDVLLNDRSNLMYISSKKARIIFVKPVSDMVKANGYYDYKDPHDKALIEGKYWLSVSEVTLD